jgi:hypothetical protein
MTNGGLVQLIAEGAPDFFFRCIGEPNFYNIHNSSKYYFINNDDGFPIKSDLSEQPFILDHIPEYLKPFSVKKGKRYLSPFFRFLEIRDSKSAIVFFSKLIASIDE